MRAFGNGGLIIVQVTFGSDVLLLDNGDACHPVPGV